MANKPNQKIKLLYLLKMFIEKTDEQKGMSTAEIIAELNSYGIDAERKSIYRDMDALRAFGLEISQVDGRNWQLVTRPFSSLEFRQLSQAIKAADFLSETDVENLIARLAVFASADQREIFKEDKQEATTFTRAIVDSAEPAPDAVGVIQQAFEQSRRITFKYFGYSNRLEPVLFNEGKPYDVTPVELVYNAGRYYLIVYSNQPATPKDPFAICRVDRMTEVTLSEKPAIKASGVEDFNLNEFAAIEFGIERAERVPVVLLVKPEAVDAAVDMFGTDMKTFLKWDGRVELHVKAPLTASFFSWLFKQGGAIKLTAPRKAIDAFQAHIDAVSELYN